MNAFIKNYGDSAVNAYRTADSAIDELVESLEKFSKEQRFDSQWIADIDMAIHRAKQSHLKLHTIQALIIELEGSGYGD